MKEKSVAVVRVTSTIPAEHPRGGAAQEGTAMAYRRFGIVVSLSHAAALVAIACGGGGGGSGPGFNNVSQLNAIWTLSGTYNFTCNGATENEAIAGAKVYLYGGSFNEQADTASTGELSFTLTNTNEDPFDGSWGLTVKCGNAILVTGGIIIQNGSISASVSQQQFYCTATGIVGVPNITTAPLTGSLTSDGALTAALVQNGGGGTLSFSQTATSLTSISASGTYGATMSLSRSAP